MVTGMDHMSRQKQVSPPHLCPAHVAHYVLGLWPFLVLLYLFRRDLSNDTSCVIIGVSMCLLSLFIFFLIFFSLISLHKLQGREGREKNKQRKKKPRHIKILMMTSPLSLKRSLLPLEHSCGSQTVNAVGHTSRLKMSRLACFWSACVAHSGHCWWLFSMSLYPSRHIFLIAPIASSLEFQCDVEIFFFSLSPY